MKKIYLAIAAVVVGGTSVAQVNFGPQKASSIVDVRNSMSQARPALTEVAPINRGSAVWTDDFTTTSNWTATTGAGHNPTGSSNPGWQFLTAVPTSLTNQGAYTTLNSSSGGNFAFIDSDAPGPQATQDADLTWSGAPIDLSGAGTNFLSIEWEQIHRMFYDIHTLSVSTDGGATWTDFEVNTFYGADVNNYIAHQGIPNPEFVSVPVGGIFDPFVSGGGTLNNVSIKFNYQGAYDWYWAIDDIVFVPTPADEMNQLYGRFAASTTDPIWGDHLPYGVVSDEQRDPSGYIFFNAAVNEGSNTQASFSLSAEVMNGMTSVFTATGVGASNIAPLDTARDTSATAFQPAANAALYDMNVTFTYSNIGTDSDPTNNDATSTLEIVDNWYGRAPGVYSGTGTYNGDDGAGNANPGISGPMVVAYANQNLEGLRIALQGNTDAGATIYPYIVELDPAAADFQSLFVNVLYDGSQIANGEYTVQAGDISSGGNLVWVDLPLQSPVALTAGSAYVLGVGYLGGPNAIIMTGAPFAPDATNFVYDAVGANNGNIQWFWLGSTAKIYGLFDIGLGVEEEAAKGIELSQNFPNPANGVTTINYTLSNAANMVTIDVVDVTGKRVMTVAQGFRGAGQYTVEFNTEDLSEGVYFYTLTADGNKITKRMVVSK